MSFACPEFIINMDTKLCASVDIYCERLSATPDAEPANAFTNVAFLVSAGFAWALWKRYRNPENAILVPALVLFTVVIGVGSFAFHIAANIWTQWADVVPILVFILIYLWLVLTRFFDWSAGATIFTLVVYLVATLYLETNMAPTILWGGAMYLPALGALIAAAGCSRAGRWPGAR
jgi:hypothetical protein